MTRDEVEKQTVAFLRTARGTRPDLRVVEIGGRRTVVKDFRRSDPLFRLLVGPILVRRERGALARLRAVEGVPQFIETIDRYAIAVEHVDGRSLGDVRELVPERFFDRLAEVVERVHERGVAHCDLRNLGNVIVASDGEPHIIDFAGCVIRGRGWNPFINFLFRQFALADRYAVLILKRKHAPDLLRPEELDRIEASLPYERIAIRVGTGLRKLAKRLLTRRDPEPGPPDTATHDP
jgi:serine/threonine protein kinase